MKKIWTSVVGFAGMVAPTIALAQNGGLDTFKNDTNLGQTELIPTIAKIINILLGFLGVVAIVIILVAGFRWMTAGGNEEKVGEAKKMLGAGVIGLVIILAAFAIASYVISTLVTQTGSTGI